MSEQHIGELAELYVLGDLEPGERSAVEVHIASCIQCLRQVGEAEETLLALERGSLAEPTPAFLDRQMRFAAPRRRYAALALAAAAGLVLGILTMLPGYFRPQAPQAALVAMIHSHFNHAQFAVVGSANAPAAKVIYARDRSWLFIVADGSQRYAVYAINGPASTRLGDLQVQGATSTLYVAHAPAADAVELRDGSTVVERAALR